MHFEWNEKYSVGVKEIDKQHKYFVNLIDELYQAMNENRAPEILNNFFDKLAKYAELHFSTEEKYMKRFGCLGTQEHIAEHDKMRKHIVDLKRKINTDKIALSFDLIDFLEDWLTGHISRYDMKYVDCFHKHGLS